MGGLSEALKKSAIENGVKFLLNSEVKEINVDTANFHKKATGKK